jgi:hypothetical protein
MVIIARLGLIIFSFFIFRFCKVEATWGRVPVIIPSTHWFHCSRDYTSRRVFLIPTLDLVNSVGLGLAWIENTDQLITKPEETVSIIAAGQQESSSKQRVTWQIPVLA